MIILEIIGGFAVLGVIGYGIYFLTNTVKVIPPKFDEDNNNVTSNTKNKDVE